MHFRRDSEKLYGQVDQVEIRLEDLEMSAAKAEPAPADPATSN